MKEEYNRSINIAKKILGNCDESIDSNVIEAIETIFPELNKTKLKMKRYEKPTIEDIPMEKEKVLAQSPENYNQYTDDSQDDWGDGFEPIEDEGEIDW